MNRAALMEDAEPNEDELLALQLEIARRADELVHLRGRAGHATIDRECWLQAESEVLSRRDEPALVA